MPRTLLPVLPGDKEERRCFAFFRGHTVLNFGIYDAGFWDGLLLQISHTEPAVHHGVVALASLHEAFSCVTEYKSGIDEYSLKQYNKSLGGLYRYISSAKDKSLEIVMICCILFTLFESFRGDYDSAGKHLQSGLKILSGSRLDPRSLKTLHDDILPVLFKLRVQARPFFDMEFNLDCPLNTVAVCVPKRFSSLREARNMFYSIMNLVLDFCRFKIQVLHKCEIQSGKQAETLLEQQTYYASLLEQWEAGFDDLLSRLSISMDSKDKNVAILSKLHHATVTTMLEFTITNSICNFDRLLPRFQRIVSLAKSLIEATEGTDILWVELWVDASIRAPLFFVATKCRDPSLRREAARLISSSGRKSTWHSRAAATIAERVIEIEEERLPFVNVARDVPEFSRLKSLRPSKIDLEAHQVKLVFQQETKFGGEISTFEESLT
ncbi:hypothetical protein MMC29_002658, partial [Sticta canariensis]|nr:hypothetical protein [Sticta canariensis]